MDSFDRADGSDEYARLLKRRKKSIPLIPLALGLALLVLTGGWWYFRAHKPRVAPLKAEQLSIQGVHLGDSYAQLLKLRGKPALERRGRDGSRVLSFGPGRPDEVYLLQGNKVVSMEVRGSGSVQFPDRDVKVGDSLESIVKILGMPDPANSPGLNRDVWLCEDFRFGAEAGYGASAASLIVYTL